MDLLASFLFELFKFLTVLINNCNKFPYLLICIWQQVHVLVFLVLGDGHRVQHRLMQGQSLLVRHIRIQFQFLVVLYKSLRVLCLLKIPISSLPYPLIDLSEQINLILASCQYLLVLGILLINKCLECLHAILLHILC